MNCLRSSGGETALLDLRQSTSCGLHVEPGDHALIGEHVVVTPDWTIWWRRAHHPSPPADLPAEEAALVAEETTAIVLGGLLSSGARWVDEPFAVLRAEHTLLQLATARRLGVRIPATCGTSTPSKAAEFASAGPTLAKTISGGTGLAPFADLIGPGDTDLVRNGATVLQQCIQATDDLRVIVVDSTVMTWRRARKADEPIDWRSADPEGSRFTLIDAPFKHYLADAAVRVNRALGLTVSAQDWLVPTDGGPLVFLEANPAGAWLFLKDSEEVVAPTLARHLTRAGHSEMRETRTEVLR